MVNINDPILYKMTRKKKYKIHCYMPRLGTKVYNKFEKSHYITDKNKPFVLVGTQGEEWVVDLKKLCATYTYVSGSPITYASLKNKLNADGTIDKFPIVASGCNLNYALRVPVAQKVSINTAWGDVLQVNAPGVKHGKGDFIVCGVDNNGQPMLNDRWVVNGLIFEDTYDMRPF